MDGAQVGGACTLGWERCDVKAKGWYDVKVKNGARERPWLGKGSLYWLVGQRTHLPIGRVGGTTVHPPIGVELVGPRAHPCIPRGSGKSPPPALSSLPPQSCPSFASGEEEHARGGERHVSDCRLSSTVRSRSHSGPRPVHVCACVCVALVGLAVSVCLCLFTSPKCA